MMGGHHAASGAAAWIAVTTNFQLPLGPLADAVSFLPATIPLGFGLFDVSPAGIVAGALVCAGAALVPDADHRHATIAHSLPPVSNAVCAGIGEISGGHRNGTHSLLGIAVFTFIAWLAGMWTVESERFGLVFPGVGILGVLLVAFAVKALKFVPDSMRRFPWLVAIPAGAFIALFAPDEQYWFVLAMALGTTVHILGDMLTVGGCNLLWPIKIKSPRFLRRIPLFKDVWKPSGRIALPILGRAGSGREWALCIPISIYAFLGILVPILGIIKTQSEPLVALFGF